MQSFRPHTLLYPVFAVLLAIGAVSQPALARSDHKATTAQEQAPNKVQKLRIERRDTIMRLGKIERKTIMGDKKLQAQRQRFSKHVIKAMKKIGYDPEGDNKKLVEIRKNIVSGKLSKEERTAQIRKFRSIRVRLIKGQMTVMRQDKGLQKENRKLNQATIAAMKKQDPHTDTLLKHLKQINQQLRRLYQAAQSHKK